MKQLNKKFSNNKVILIFFGKVSSAKTSIINTKVSEIAMKHKDKVKLLPVNDRENA